MGIRTKLTLAMLGLAVLITVIAFVGVLLSFRSGFLGYINEAQQVKLEEIAEALSQSVTSQEEWQNLTQNRFLWGLFLRRHAVNNSDEPQKEFPKLKPQQKREYPLPRSTDHGQDHSLPDRDPPRLKKPRPPKVKIFLLDSEQQFIYGRPMPVSSLVIKPIIIKDEQVGFVAMPKIERVMAGADQRFIEKQTRFFIIILFTAIVVSALLAFILSHWVTTPIRRLGVGMQRLIQREYDVEIQTKSRDEIGRLIAAFNVLAKTLDSHEKSQRQWIADISHELRTPLATLRCEVEALIDGVRDFSEESVQSLYDEILFLKRIVDDLHQLAVSDLGALSYEFNPILLGDLTERFIHTQKFQLEQKDIHCVVNVKNAQKSILGDESRLQQLMNNLLQNTLRYTEKPGQLVITIDCSHSDYCLFFWEDSSPGVADESLPLLFERLFREEKSRNRALGGTGLGLAIVKCIVSSHNGHIHAELSELGGLKIGIKLPYAT